MLYFPCTGVRKRVTVFFRRIRVLGTFVMTRGVNLLRDVVNNVDKNHQSTWCVPLAFRGRFTIGLEVLCV